MKYSLDSDAQYTVIQISEKDTLESEPLGSKKKFWVALESKDRFEEWLFKVPRANTGEHWAEKIAYETARLLEIPCAIVELAEFQGEIKGSCSKSFINVGKKPELIHGNEILAGRILGYDKHKKYDQRKHTLDNIIAAIQKIGDDHDKYRALKQFSGYLVLDALIGNTDRHHENWAYLRWTDNKKQTFHVLAPTFDHASSLGRELLDEKRDLLLREDRIEDYIKKGSGAIFGSSVDNKGLNPIELVYHAKRQFPEFFQPWLEKIREIQQASFGHIISRIPDRYMTEKAKEFSLGLLYHNLEKLKALR